MKLKILLSSFIYSLIGVLILFQANIVLAIASDPNNPITSAITTAITGVPSPTPTTPAPTTTPEPSQVPVSTPIINPTPTPIPISAPITNPSPTPIASQNPTASPTPAPVLAAAISTIFPNPATQGTEITLTGSNFTNSSRVYIGGALMSTQFYVGSEDGTVLKFRLDTEVNFVAGNTYTLTIENGVTLSNTVLLTIAPSVTQTVPPLKTNQVLVAPSVILDPNHQEVVLASSNFNTSIIIPSSVPNPTINFSNLLTTSSSQNTAIFNNIVNINSSTSLGNVGIQIPALTTISGPANWNGVINAPKVLPNQQASPTADSGTTVTTQFVIEVGLGDTPLIFDKAVRILIPGQAGKLAGFQRGSTFTRIVQSCSADTQTLADTLSAGDNCYISVGSDLVIWTKHFTKFVTYTQSSSSSSSSSNSNSSSSAVCTDTKPKSAPKLLSAVASGRNQVTLNWSKAGDPITYYLITYGTKPGKQEYGNPNVGGKDTTSYIVKSLENGKTYYFQVRAGNNCMPGEFSNEIAVKASGDKFGGPAVGFKAGVLSTQSPSQKSTTDEQLKFKPITSANPQRAIISSGNIITKFISFLSSLFAKK